MKKVWILFSVANEYNQPENDLVAWWSEKPKIPDLLNVVGLSQSTVIGLLLEGIDIGIGEATFRLRQIKEGKVEDVS